MRACAECRSIFSRLSFALVLEQTRGLNLVAGRALTVSACEQWCLERKRRAISDVVAKKRSFYCWPCGSVLESRLVARKLRLLID